MSATPNPVGSRPLAALKASNAAQSAPDLPERCPSCGETVETRFDRWEKLRQARRVILRVPVCLIVSYFCGAAIEAAFEVRTHALGTATSHGNSARWHTRVTAGCLASTQHAFDQLTLVQPDTTCPASTSRAQGAFL